MLHIPLTLSDNSGLQSAISLRDVRLKTPGDRVRQSV
jgi:hypothetical protein